MSLSNLKNIDIRYRIVIFCTILVVVVQGITFWVVNTSNLVAAQKSSRQDLQVGAKVLRRYLLEIAKQHLETANVLASDFGLRAAIATFEPDTVQSLVANHRKRVDADLFMVLLPDKSLLATSAPAGSGLLNGELSKLIDQAEAKGYASGYSVIKDLAYEVTVVPVFAPDLTAWLVLSSKIDESLARDISELNGQSVSFLNRQNGVLKPLASTLPIEPLLSLKNQLVIGLNSDPDLETLVWGDYVNQLIRFEDSNIVAILHSSLSEARAEMNRLSKLFIILLLASVGIAILGSLLIARHIMRPLGLLAEIASNIQRGDYNQAAEIAKGDEIGILAESLDHMRKTIAVLLELAYHDALTSLPNRAMFNNHLLQTLKVCERNKAQFTFLMIDLDEFKQINDTYGHEAGDAVIKEAGKRLQQALRESDLVARIGGDEFAVILMSHDVDDIQSIADKIHLNLAQTIKMGDLSLTTACSIGAAIFPEHGSDTITLMRHADISMYLSKRSKSTSVIIYNDSYETIS